MCNIILKRADYCRVKQGEIGTRGPRGCTCRVLFMHYFSLSLIWGQLMYFAKFSMFRFLKDYSHILRQISTKIMESVVNRGNIA